MLYAAYKAGDKAISEKINNSLRKDMQQQAAYYQSLPDSKRESLSQEEERNAGLLKNLMGMEQQFKMMQNNIPAPAPVKNAASTDTAKP